MKSIRIIGLFLFGFLSLDTFSAQLATPIAEVTRISLSSHVEYTERQDAIMFQLKGVTTLGNCPKSGTGDVWFIIMGEDKAMISYLMAANMSNKKIRAFVISDLESNLHSGWCRASTITWEE